MLNSNRPRLEHGLAARIQLALQNPGTRGVEMLSMFLSADIQDLTRLAKLGMQASAKIEMLNRRVAQTCSSPFNCCQRLPRVSCTSALGRLSSMQLRKLRKPYKATPAHSPVPGPRAPSPLAEESVRLERARPFCSTFAARRRRHAR